MVSAAEFSLNPGNATAPMRMDSTPMKRMEHLGVPMKLEASDNYMKVTYKRVGLCPGWGKARCCRQITSSSGPPFDISILTVQSALQNFPDVGPEDIWFFHVFRPSFS